MEGKIPKGWKEEHRKGKCGNWKGITLLNVTSKVFSRTRYSKGYTVKLNRNRVALGLIIPLVTVSVQLEVYL